MLRFNNKAVGVKLFVLEAVTSAKPELSQIKNKMGVGGVHKCHVKGTTLSSILWENQSVSVF